MDTYNGYSVTRATAYTGGRVSFDTYHCADCEFSTTREDRMSVHREIHHHAVTEN